MHTLQQFKNIFFFFLSFATQIVLPSQQHIITEKTERHHQVDNIVFGELDRIKVKGTLGLQKGMPLGFGSQDYINYLNDINIPAQQEIPMAAINILIKETDQEETNWTISMPRSVEKLLAEKISHWDKALQPLLETDDREDGQIRAYWENLQRKIAQKKYLPFPTLIPIDRISALENSIEFKNIFGLFDITLKFKKHHQMIHIARNNMDSNLGFFAIVDPKTTELIRELIHADDEEDTSELEEEIDRRAGYFLNNMIQELLDNEIIKPKKPHTPVSTIAFEGSFQQCIVYREDKAFSPTQKVDDLLRKNILAKRQLPNPFTHIRERECKRQKLSHF